MDAIWPWVERASWLVAIVGIPSLIVGLLALARRPRLLVGFVPFRKAGLFGRRQEPQADTSVKATFTSPQLSDMVQLHLVVVNRGRGSARDLLVNFKFPPELDETHVAVAPAAGHLLMRLPDYGGLVWSFKHDYLHPDDRLFCEFGLRVPAQLDRIDIRHEISMADAPAATGSSVVLVA